MLKFQTQVLTTVAITITASAVPTRAETDGFGDGDRNNDGAITALDSDTLDAPLDADDTGLIWLATRGHTPDGDRKAYLTVVDDAAGDAESPGFQSGYALGVEGKGSGASFAGFLNEPVKLGEDVGDRVDASFDFRGWSQADNPTAYRVIGNLCVGLYQDTDGQLGQSAERGYESAEIIWGRDDGQWQQSDPGPVGDKGYFMKVPIGLAADPINSRLLYENNTRRFLIGGDVHVVANPNAAVHGQGGAIHNLKEGTRVRLSVVRTARGILLESYFDGHLALRGEVTRADEAVQARGAAPETFDYLAFRISDDWDMMLDNVAIKSVPAPKRDAVVFTDTFEDADRDNNGYAVKDVDVDTDGRIDDTWKSGNPAFEQPIAEVADPGPGVPTAGLTWFAAGGFAGTDPKSNPTILNDTPGSETDGSLPDSVHLNSGLALGLEGKGRGTSTNGFFDPTPTPGEPNDQRVTLGLNAGDRVRLGFDWRVWESIYAVNDPLLPTRARLSFGLFQDTDHQLGLNSEHAGPNGVPAVWGEDDGLFRGDLARIGPGSNGDHGVYVHLYIGEPVLADEEGDGAPDLTGDLCRIIEETNPGVSVPALYMTGSDADPVAAPEKGDPADPASYFPLLQVGTAYRIELTLERTVAAAYPGDPDGLFTATVAVHELDADRNVVSTHRFGGEESPGDPLAPDPATDGVQSDVWDYVGFRNSGGDPDEDFDMVIDNVTVEALFIGADSGTEK